MFTGLIREVGKVVQDNQHFLTIHSTLKPKIGDSIAVNGVCLTVTNTLDKGFVVEVADETRRIIPSEKFKGDVHLEPAMQLSDRFEGHIVQGHIDTIGTIESIQSGENATEFFIRIDESKVAYLVPKGSVTIDGISLTINEVGSDWFRLTIIPHTLENTLFKQYTIGTKLNIETDLFARYIEHILKNRQNSKQQMSWSNIDAISLSF